MKQKDINEYIASMRASPRFEDQVVFHKILEKSDSQWAETERPLPGEIRQILDRAGIRQLYAHQVSAIDGIRSGHHVVVATPTASGKSLIYNIPMLEKIWMNRNSKAIYLFPLKALAQDQLRSFRTLSEGSDTLHPTMEIYDGDTSAWHRKRVRNTPPNILLTNPEMLHLSILAYHQLWAALLSDLEMVVIDEVHTYRGVMGSHMAQVFRRFIRICSFYGASPVFVFCSATVANPSELATDLTGLHVKTVTKTGAPQGKKHIVFINPQEGLSQTAILLLKAALHRELRTIIYTQSRKLTELIALWTQTSSGRFAKQISAYRAGFLPEERREIERRLSNGELLAVVTTSALELGIDIGNLDLCLLIGYPGSIVATWQRGGRVGRSSQDSALVLIAGEDALDQYFMRNPDDFMKRDPEAAVINPYNPVIMERHLMCAAAELPLRSNESFVMPKPVQNALNKLEMAGELQRSADGTTWYSRKKMPHRDIDLRGVGGSFTITCAETGRHIGEVDGYRAFTEAHPGAIYLHNGITYLVKHLDLDTRSILISNARVNYYTKVRGHEHTEILDVFDHKAVWGTRVYLGRLKVTKQTTGYEKRRIHGKQNLGILPLSLPPYIFETEGIWFEIPEKIQRTAEEEWHHFMGGIHAIEHAAIGIFPLLVMADRNDLGGISTTYHAQIQSAAIFIYDGIPGGAGLTRQAFQRADRLLEFTLKAIATCPCEFGCPSCVQSPKCGSGNRPIDKAAALFLLRLLTETKEPLPVRNPIIEVKETVCGFDPIPDTSHFGVLDIETQRSADEVGGWHKAFQMGVSCAVLYDSRVDDYFEYTEQQMSELIAHLKQLEMVIGFNIKRFDYFVLKGYSSFNFGNLPTLDILEHVHLRIGYRLSLDHLSRVTLGTEKSANGLLALQWWKEGRIREIIDYCRKDVEITRDLYLFGRQNGFILFQNKAGNTVRLPVNWRASM